MVWMVVALRVTRLKMATVTPLAMLVIAMIFTRTCGVWKHGGVRSTRPASHVQTFGHLGPL